MTKCLSPTEIATLGRSFMEGEVLLAAVKLRLFGVLEDGPLTGSEIGERPGTASACHSRLPRYSGCAACARAGGDGVDAR